MRELINLKLYLIKTIDERKESTNPVDVLICMRTMRILVQLNKALHDLKKEQTLLHLN